MSEDTTSGTTPIPGTAGIGSPVRRPTPASTAAPGRGPRRVSKLERMMQPLAGDALRVAAERVGACVHPIAIVRRDVVTRKRDIMEVPCGARLASRCKPCANRVRGIRIEQIREGWHLTEEPVVRVTPPNENVLALVRSRADLQFERDAAELMGDRARVEDAEQGIREFDAALERESLRGHLTPKDRESKPRKVRSTRRRQDAPNLPRLPVEPRTVGRAFTDRRGRTHQESMLVTLTLPSCGAVHTAARYRRGGMRPCACGALHGERDPLLGVPLDPESYDYRRAALDAIHFPRVQDRFWQNLRRAAGQNVQYAGCVEMQKRLAPHSHYAVRGTHPRKLFKLVGDGTYHQVWWPSFAEPLFTVDNPPRWDPERARYVSPHTGSPLRPWEEAMADLDVADAEPAYVARLGSIDARGIKAGTKDAERSVRYVTKYLTKDISEHAAPRSDQQRDHFDRLHAELSVLPCSTRCANWLLYGVVPEDARAGLVAGRCSGKVHQRHSLGFTGRRVLISRKWSTRTMVDIRADRAAWVRAILAGSLDNEPEHPDPDDWPNRYVYSLAKPGDHLVAPLAFRILREIGARQKRRQQLDAAIAARGSPNTPPGGARAAPAA